MKHILLASHGRLALGMKDTVEFFLGKSDSIVAVSAYLDSSDAYLQDIKDFVDAATAEDSVIFTDIYGGSVNQQVTTIVLESKKEIPIISSMNLPIIMSVALSDEKVTLEYVESLMEECQPKLVTFEQQEQGDEEDEFFD